MCEEAVYDVVALGELLIDFTPVSTDGAGCPTLKANPGGAPGNLLAALSRYGRRTAFLGKVGEDAFGHLLLESLRRAGVQTRGIRLTSSAFTTLAFVTLDAAGDRSFSFARKPGADTQLRWEEVDRSLIQRCRLFHFGSLSLTDEPARSATRAAVAYARELGRTVTFDPNLRLPLWPSPAEAGPRSCGACARRMWSSSATRRWTSSGAAPPRRGPAACWRSAASPWPWSPWVPGAATSRTGGGAVP